MSKTKSNFGEGKDLDIQITLQDQQRINQFAKLNAKKDDLKAEIKAKQAVSRNLEYASEELELCTDEKVAFSMGECFLYRPLDEAMEAVQERIKQRKEEIKEIEAKQKLLTDEMSVLKRQLYAKFGDQINLEEE
ncbi:probable prefoldin subunit 4 [Cimex lectularius]|uniref:Prefoldin subunit 4 n=1 Tax=Cimex lectularius TaxID=79782 RepID=A0A8I6RN37_CIMLE|nr:probable prefoldin subunit 4 [Cimex lectularius]